MIGIMVVSMKEGSMFLRVKKSAGREYLQIVESYREKGKVRQRVIGTIGRTEELVERGQIDQLLRSLAKYSERALLLLQGQVTRKRKSRESVRHWCLSGCGNIAASAELSGNF